MCLFTEPLRGSPPISFLLLCFVLCYFVCVFFLGGLPRSVVEITDTDCRLKRQEGHAQLVCGVTT